MTKKVQPEFTFDEGNGVKGFETHPSYGLVRLGRIHTTGINLFDSELSHREYIEIEFFSAAMERGNLTRRVRRGKDRKPLLTAQLSHAQWAALISSQGIGEGVPCTLSRIRTGDSERLPEIEPIQTFQEKFSSDISDRVKLDIIHLKNIVDDLGQAVSKAKSGKKELHAIHQSLSHAVQNLPENMAFSTELTQEAVDKIVSSGKAEVEAYVAGTVSRLGLERLDQLTDTSAKTSLLSSNE